MSEAIEKIEHVTLDHELDYIDGILFSQDCGAIITGHLTNNPMLDVPIQRFSAAKEPWFYLHVEDRIKNRAGPVIEAIHPPS